MTILRPTTRLASVDALRGLTVAFMILVNDPGDWSHIYAPLDHAKWSGFTPTDLVFPTFLFLIGCAIVFSVSSRVAKGVSKSTIALQMLRRSALIFAIDLLLAAYPHFHLGDLRIFGVLTRIALVYLLAGLLFLYVRRPWALAMVAAGLLVGYWALLRYANVPGLGHPVTDFPILDQNRNLTAWIDRAFNHFTQTALHTGRLYRRTNDPEGLLSTLPSVATTLLGILAALYLRRPETGSATAPASVRWRQPGALALVGVVCLGLGLAWNISFPINKNLWTSSFVLFAGGWSLLLLALFYLLFDTLAVQRHRWGRVLLWPLLVFGMNALTAFIFSEFLAVTLLSIKTHPTPETTLSVLGWLYAHLFAIHGAGGVSTRNTSVAFAICYVALCLLPNWLLYRRRIFLRL